MTTLNKKNSFAEYIKIYAMLTLAGTLMALGIYVFVLPCSVVAGGIGGLSNILYYTFNTVSYTHLTLPTNSRV